MESYVKHVQELTKSTKLCSIIRDGDCVEFEEVFPFSDVPLCYKQNEPHRQKTAM